MAGPWSLIALLVSLGVTARWLFWNAYGRESTGMIDHYYPNVYYGSLCRFDEFLPGVAVAMLKHLHPGLWQRVMRHGQGLLALGIAATGVMVYLVCHAYRIDGYGYCFFMSAFGYSLVAMSFSILVMAALSPTSFLYRFKIPGAYPLAAASYSIYLIHKPAAHVLHNYTKTLALGPTATFLVISGVSLVVGGLSYRLVESPFMQLRERFFPSNFVPSVEPECTQHPDISSDRVAPSTSVLPAK